MPYLKREAPCPEPIDCRILTAALDLFVLNGYHNVSIHLIQQQAGVSIGSIYNHFGGKEGIAKALYKHILNEVDELIDEIIKEVNSPSAQCQEVIRQLFEHTETHPNIIGFVFNARHTEFLPEQPLICNALPFQKMQEMVRQGIKLGEFRKLDITIATSSIFGGAIRMIQLRLDSVIKEPLPDFFEATIDAAWGGLNDNPRFELSSVVDRNKASKKHRIQ